MWSQYPQPPPEQQMSQQPPPGGPPPGGPPQGGYNYNNGGRDQVNYDEQGGSALTSAVDMVASAASGLFFSGGGKPQQQPQQQQQPAPPAFHSSSQPPQAFSTQFQPPIQPTTSMLSTTPRAGPGGSGQHPPPIQVTSSLLSTAPRRHPPTTPSVAGVPPMAGPPTFMTTPGSAPPMAGGPPTSAPRPNPIPVASSLLNPSGASPVGTPLAASGPPTTTPLTAGSAPPLAGSPLAPSPLAASGGPPLAASSGPLLAASSGPPLAGSLATGIPTPRGPASVSSSRATPPATPDPSPTIVRTIAAMSPRLSSTKKLPLPPPSTTLERRKQPKVKKFKLPPAFSTTTPRKKKELALPPKATDKTTSNAATATASTTASTTAPPMTTAAPGSSARESTPKRSNTGQPAEIEPTQSVEPAHASPAPANASTAAAPKDLAAGPSSAKPSPEVITSPALVEPSLPPGWNQGTDPTTGKAYYWNELDGTTSWEPPILQEQVPPESVDAPPILPDAKNVELPKEEEAIAPAETTVEPPQATEPPIAFETEAPVEPTLESQANERATAIEAETKQPEATITSPNQLPTGWIEMMDEASGNPYYLNTTDGTTSWVRPQTGTRPTETVVESAGKTAEPENAYPEAAGEEKDEKATSQTEQTTQSEDAADASNEVMSQALPAGWVELIDEGSGRSYYVNEASGTTTWDRPAAQPETFVEDIPETAGEENETTAAASNDVAEEANELAPEITQSDNIDFPDENTDEDPTSSPAADTTMAILGDMQDALPAGWTEAVDPETGRTYYVNALEDITTWDRPASIEQSAVLGDETEAEAKEEEAPSEPEMPAEPEQPQQQAAPEVAGEKEEPGSIAPEITETRETEGLEATPDESNGEAIENDLPPAWVEVIDPSSGNPYYFNQETQECRWEKPSPPPKAALEVGGHPNEGTAVKPDDETQDVSNGFVMVGTDEAQLEESTPELTTDECKEPPPQESTEARADEKQVASEFTPETESDAVEGEVSNEADPASALPPGWEELFDANSNVTYYYNAAEGRSSWERPVLDDAVPATAPEESNESMPAEPTASAVEPKLEETPAEPEKAEEVLEQEMETPQESTETEEAEVAAAPVPAPVPVPAPAPVTADTSAGEEEEAPLPPGWVVVPDPSTGGVFFFNEVEKITSWERPSLPQAEAASTEADAQPEISPVTLDTAADEKEQPEMEIAEAGTETEAKAAQRDLPDGWVVVTDPNSGNVYYYNQVDGNSSWERPVVTLAPENGTNGKTEESDNPPAGDDESQEPPYEQAATAKAAMGADESKQVSDLPEGWEAIFDESSGLTHYYNHLDGTAVWDRPANPDDANQLDESPEAGEADALAPETGAGASEEGEQATDVAAVASESAEAEDEAEASEEPTKAVETIDNELPPGWIDGVDPSTGRIFYFNEIDNSSSWERPAKTDNAEVVSPEAVEATDSGEKPESNDIAVEELPPEPKSDDQLDAGSMDQSAASAGNTEGEASPELPVAPASDAVTEEPEHEGDLPPGWVAIQDPSSGNTYYSNQLDGTTSWERPRAEVTAAETTDTDADETAPELEDEQPLAPDTVNEVGQVPGEESAEPKEDSGDAEEQSRLPPGWEEIADPSTGNAYYYNHNDGSSSWERPIEAAGEDGASSDVAEAPGPEVTQEDAQADHPPPTVAAEDGQRDDAQLTPVEDDVTSLEAEKEADDTLAPEDTSQLPPGWIELVDASTDQPYFLNEIDGTTTWDRPQLAFTAGSEGDQPPAVEEVAPDVTNVEVDLQEESPIEEATTEDNHPQVEPEAELETDVGHSGDDGQQVPAEEIAEEVAPSESLPPGWVASTDPSTGNVFYYNESNGTTTWETPIWPEQEAQAPLGESLVGAATTEDTEVAEGVVPDRNEETQPSDHEEIAAVEGQPLDLPETAVDDPSQQVSAPENSGDVAEQSDLPEGWTEVIDPASGNAYYTHVDGTTTWDRPPMPTEAEVDTDFLLSDPIVAEDPSPEARIEDFHAEAEDEAETVPTPETDGQSGLPPDWEEVVDANTGSTYYFNHATNETSWERPSWPAEEVATQTGQAETEERAAGAMDGVPQMSTEDTLGLEYSGSEAAVAESELPDAVGGAEGPGVVEELVDQSEAAPVIESDFPTDEPEESALPPGWTESVDPQSGRPFYVNEVDNTSSWERPVFEGQEDPALGPQDATGDLGEPSVESTIPQTDPEPENTAPEIGDAVLGPESLGPLPEGWQEMVDESSGKPYYIKLETNETSWDRPISEVVKEDEVRALGAEGALPEGWAEITDPNGQVYYLNETLGITQWERPVSDLSPQQDPSSSMLPTGTAEGDKADVTSSGDRRRPAHAIATFGFGGRLCVFRATGSRQVEVHRTRDLVPSHDLVKIEATKEREGIFGPLNSADQDRVKAYVERKTEENPTDLLWHLIHIVSKSKGRIRSQKAMADANSPETAIVDLMLADGLRPAVTPQNGGTNGNRGTPHGNGAEKKDAKAGMESIQNYILRGKRAEAIEVALESKNFALALLVSTFCDRETYYHVVKQYADEVLRGSSPLHTIAMLFSEQYASLWSSNSKELLGSWRYHLAALISNRIDGWDRIVVALGCKLQELGDLHAAHVCFMVSGLQLMSPILPETYMSLLGCDHFLPENISLMTQQGIEAYERTEAYEWAKRRGNPSALIRTLQPFKLHYAILLADLGYVALAKMYLEHILVVVELDGDDSRFHNHVVARLTLPEMCESPDAFRAALASFEQRLFRNIPSVSDGSPTKMAAKPQGIPLLEQDEYPEISRTATGDSDVSFMTASSFAPDTTLLDASAQPKTKDKVKAKAAPSKIIRKRNTKKEDKNEELEAKAPKDKGEPGATSAKPAGGPGKLASPMSSPPGGTAPPSQLKTAPTDETKPASATKGSKGPTSTKKPAPAPKSAPAVMVQKRDWTFGMANRMQKWLNPEATTADLGEGMQAYYCPEKKVWVFPGEDPAEVAKPLPPPPTPADMMIPKEEPKPEPDMATDPLAAMMAPPKRTPASYGRSRPGGGAPSGGVPATPRSLYPGMPPMPGSAPATNASGPGPAIPGSAGGAPPQFMVFKPAAKPEGEEQEQKGDAKAEE